VSAGTACATLAAGLLGTAWAWFRGRRDAPEARIPLLASLVALALLASPIAWYHYQMMQLPGLAWLTADAFRRRTWSRLAGVTALEFALTRSEFRDLLAGRPAGQAMLPGIALALLGVILFGLLLAEVRRPTAPAPSS
jgi:hypothetical protein